jgi:hypothetical protein
MIYYNCERRHYYIMNKVKELHLYMDLGSLHEDFENGVFENSYFGETYRDTLHSLNCTDESGKVYTTISSFLKFDYADRLFVHSDRKIHEITLGDCEGTEKDIKIYHNLEKMLLAGVFKWFDPDKDYDGG